jgi:hypothetical protein
MFNAESKSANLSKRSQCFKTVINTARFLAGAFLQADNLFSICVPGDAEVRVLMLVVDSRNISDFNVEEIRAFLGDIAGLEDGSGLDAGWVGTKGIGIPSANDLWGESRKT